MKRLHIHIAVDQLSESVRFYSTLFDAQPTVSKPDYAKWMLDDPRVNFAISQRGAAVGLNHLGMQVESAQELSELHQRLEKLQLGVTEQSQAACCYAKSDKYWVQDPQGIAWESFHTLESIPVFGADEGGQANAEGCCIPLAKTDSASACCVPTGKSGAAGGCC